MLSANSAVQSPGVGRLRVSIVCYASCEPQLRKTADTLLSASRMCLERGYLRSVDVFFVNNGPAESENRKIENIIKGMKCPAGTRLLSCGSGENIGFGAGHNLVLNANAAEFHLVLNPDVEIASDALSVALEFMGAHGDCGLLSPSVTNGFGEVEYLCKRYPSVLDLMLRGFGPAWLQSVFRHRLARYEMRDAVADSVVWQPPLVSGCFMLLRSSLLEQLNGFDIKYFLYFEDYDFSLRAGAVTRVAYVPTVRVIHHGGYASRKGWRHIVLFIRSAFVFFNQHGWKFW